jgi:hypothetical protein
MYSRSALLTSTITRAMAYQVNKVERLPTILEDGFVYVSGEYGIAALKCACGCGHRVTLLLGDGHTVNDVGGLADVWPSIGVWAAACRSHFWIRNGKVFWAEQYSEAEIRTAMKHQLERHVERTRPRVSWHQRFLSWLRSIFRPPS